MFYSQPFWSGEHFDLPEIEKLSVAKNQYNKADKQTLPETLLVFNAKQIVNFLTRVDNTREILVTNCNINCMLVVRKKCNLVIRKKVL